MLFLSKKKKKLKQTNLQTRKKDSSNGEYISLPIVKDFIQNFWK